MRPAPFFLTVKWVDTRGLWGYVSLTLVAAVKRRWFWEHSQGKYISGKHPSFPEFSNQSSDIPSFTPFLGTPGVGASVGAGIFVITGVAAQPCGPAVCGWADEKSWEFLWENDPWIGKGIFCWIHFQKNKSIHFQRCFFSLTWAGLQIHGPAKIEQLSTRKKMTIFAIACF